MKYRLGLDMGSNSIGWCAVRLDEEDRPCGVLDAGVRILTPNDEAGRDPQSKQSLAAGRRAARSMRRRRDRFVRRRERLMEVLVKAGLLPDDRDERKKLERIDPYWLRAAALDQRLELSEFGRALFHLNQRRGFQSNRLAGNEDDDRGAVRQGAQALESRLEREGVRTVGELLARWHGRDRYGRRQKDGGTWRAPHAVRFRPTTQGARNIYDFYPLRAMIATELAKMWESQRRWHPELDDELRDRIKRIIIEQRPLKRPLVGRCTLMPEENKANQYGLDIDQGERAPKAHPLFQRFRILQDVCQLRVRRNGESRHLSLQERDAIVDVLMKRRSRTVAFDKLKNAARLPDDARLNYENLGRKGFIPDETGAKLAQKKALGSKWLNLSLDEQTEVVERLLAEEDEELLLQWLEEHHHVSPETARVVSDLRLPQGHCQFGRAALSLLVAAMEDESCEAVDQSTGEVYERPLTYDEAVLCLDLHHSDRRPASLRDHLPYYGEALARHVISPPHAAPGTQEQRARVANPTVHIGLNQVRKVVNELIDVHGKPAGIVVELARDLKLNAERKRQVLANQREGEKRNESIREELSSLELADTYGNRMLLRLYDELPAEQRVCVYSGTPISKQMLFSDGVEIDHILPHQRTLDDSFMNKVLCLRQQNRIKNNRAPAEAWHGDELEEITQRARQVVPRKAWRFESDAMDKLRGEDESPLARHLTDTQHMSRLAKEYLSLVCPKVRASPGRLTAMLRAKWGLNRLLSAGDGASEAKNRLDHRHHAVDAFVIACTDQGLLNRVSTEAGRAADLDLDRLYPSGQFPEPFEGYRAELSRCIDGLIVSHKPDHGLSPGGGHDPRVTSGKLLEETAYGCVNEEIDGNLFNLVARKPIASLSPKEIGQVRDGRLRRQLAQATEGLTGKPLRDALSAFGEAHGVRRVRVLKKEAKVRVVRHGDGFVKAYVPGDNHRIEIYETADGKWHGEGVAAFDANQPAFEPLWRNQESESRHVMTVHKGDLIEADFGEGEGRTIYRVARLQPSANRVRLAPHFAVNAEKPNRLLKAYSRLKAAGARRVRVDPIGRVYPVTL